MNTSTELRQRKPVPTAALVEDKEDVKKPLPTNNNNLIATLLFLVSLPVRFKNVALPAQVV